MSSLTVAWVLSHIRTPLYRNAYALIFSATTSSMLGLVYWVLAARFYPAEVVGLNSAIVSAVLFLGGLAQLSLNNVMVRFVPRAGSFTYRLITYTYLISLLAAGLMSTVFLLGMHFWAPVMSYMRTSPKWWFSFNLAVMTWCIFALQDSVLTGLRQAIWVPVENTLYSILKIILLVGFAMQFPREGIFLSWVIPVLISLLPVNLLILLRLIPIHIESTNGQSSPISLWEIIRFASGNYLGSLFFLTSASLLPLIVTNLAGPRANAYFYPAWAITAGLQFIANNLSISLTVEASLDQTKLIAYSRRVLIQTVGLLVPIVIIILLGGHFILGAFGRIYAAEGTTVLRLLALGTLPNILITLSISLARIQNRAHVITMIQGTLCILFLGLSLVFLPILGINGVGIAWIISQTSLAIVLILTELRRVLFIKGGLQARTTK